MYFLCHCSAYHHDAYIYPYVTYCIEVWDCASQSQLNCVCLLEMKIIRIMSFSYYLAHLINFFFQWKEDIFYNVGLIMYKYSNNLLPKCIAQLHMQNDSIHEHNTRECHLLRVLPGAKTFSNISAPIWNVLSNKINCDVSKVYAKTFLSA